MHRQKKKKSGHKGQRVDSWGIHPNLQFSNSLTIAYNITNIFLSITFHWSHDLAQNWTFFLTRKDVSTSFSSISYWNTLIKLVRWCQIIFFGGKGVEWRGKYVGFEVCFYTTYQNLNAFFFHRSSVISSFTHSHHCGDTVFLKFLGSEKKK